MVCIRAFFKLAGFLAMMIIIQSCQHAPVDMVYLKKVNSDLYPSRITRAEYHYQIAMGYRSQRLFDKAIDTFRLAILHDPQFGPAHLELAHTYVKLEKFSLATSEIDRFLQLQTPTIDEVFFITELFVKAGSFDRVIQLQDVAFNNYKKNSFLWSKYALEMEISYYEQAEMTLNLLKQHDESAFLVEMGRGEIKVQQKKWLEAANAFKAADLDRPNQELTLRRWIKVSIDSKDYEHVIALSKRYFRFHAYNIQVSQQLAFAAIQSGKYELALDELAIQKKINPWDYSIDYQTANTYFMKKDYATAETLYRYLYRVTDSEQSLYFLALIQIEKNNIDGASKLVENLAVMSDYYPKMQIQLARLEWKNNQRDRALDRMYAAQVRRSDSIEIQREYVQILIWEKRYDVAMAQIVKVREIYSDDVPLAALAASIHFMLDNHESYQKEIDFVMQKEPNNPDYYVMMSELWYKKNRPAPDVELFARKAIELNSTNPNIKPLLAWALLKQEKLTEAVQIFESLYDENPKDLFFAQALTEIYSKNNLQMTTKDMISRSLNIRLNSNHKHNTYFEDLNQAAKMNAVASSAGVPAAPLKGAEDPVHQRLPANIDSLGTPEKK